MQCLSTTTAKPTHKKDDDNEEIEEAENPLLVSKVLVRVAQTYMANWQTYALISAFCVLPSIRPLTRLQEAIEYVLNDPIYLYHLSNAEGKNPVLYQILRIGEFFYRVFIEWGEMSVRGRIISAILLPILSVLARLAVTKVALQHLQQYYQIGDAEKSQPWLPRFKALFSQLFHVTRNPQVVKNWLRAQEPRLRAQGNNWLRILTEIAASKKLQKQLWQEVSKGIGVSMLLFLGQIIANTAVLIWLGPTPLHIGWIIGIPKPITAVFCFGSMCFAFHGLAPFLLAFPMVFHEELPAKQGLRKAWKMGYVVQYDVWFAHALLWYFYGAFGTALRVFAAWRYDDNYMEMAFQHLPWLVFMPCFTILQTDLYLHCSGIISPPESKQEKEVWMGVEDDNTTDQDSSSDDSMPDLRSRPAKEV